MGIEGLSFGFQDPTALCLSSKTLTNPNAPFHKTTEQYRPGWPATCSLTGRATCRQKYVNNKTTRNTQIIHSIIQTNSSKERGEEKYKHIQ